MIKPTVGRKVWYRPSETETLQRTSEGPQMGIILHVLEGMSGVGGFMQPLDATIIGVHVNGLVNLYIIDAMGLPHVRLNATLKQEGDGYIDGGYAEWMPYQIGQAKKDEPKTSGHVELDNIGNDKSNW